MTTESASITNSAAVMMTTVAGDANAIGYKKFVERMAKKAS